MGRQINFYMNKKIEEQFIEFIRKQQFDIVDPMGNIVSDYKNTWRLFLYNPKYGQLIYVDSNKIVDYNNIPVIEFQRTYIDASKMREGRLYISSYIKFTDEETKKLFIKDYNALVRFIRKKIPYQQPFDGGTKRYICDDLVDIFNSFRRGIIQGIEGDQ